MTDSIFPAAPATISKITATRVFDRFSYTLTLPTAPTEALSRVLIVYGDNGSGKTTILRLLFHLLSPGESRGHRTAMARTPFEHFAVEFTDGVTVAATRAPDNIIGGYTLSLVLRGDVASSVRVDIDDENKVPTRGNDEIDVFMTEVQHRHNLDVFYLGDDRRVVSDTLREESEDHDVIVSPAGELIRRKQERDDVALALRRAVAWLRQQTLGAANVGSESANAIYADVVRRIATPSPYEATSDAASKQHLVDRLSSLERRSQEFARFELTAPLRVDAMLEATRAVSDENVHVIGGVLTPFLDGQEARLDALAGVYEALDSFVGALNGFYEGKHVSVNLRRGIEVRTDDDQVLTPEALSSGERHLLLLFATTLYARSRPPLFVIDEPELSLNMKWQRDVLTSLLAGTANSGAQFVLASHSFELITAARERVVHLSHGVAQRLAV